MKKLDDMQVFQNWPKRYLLRFCFACNNDKTNFLDGGSLVYICRSLLKIVELKIH